MPVSSIPARARSVEKLLARRYPSPRTELHWSSPWELLVATILSAQCTDARVNMVTGLFKVLDRVWQVRGMDIANMTIIEGDTGLILIDPLTYCEAAAAALALYRRHRGGL